MMLMKVEGQLKEDVDTVNDRDGWNEISQKGSKGEREWAEVDGKSGEEDGETESEEQGKKKMMNMMREL